MATYKDVLAASSPEQATELTDECISALEIEASAVGDHAMAHLCRRALAGDIPAYARCVKALEEAHGASGDE